MKRSLRKTAFGVSVAYSDDNYSNNLSGTDFELDRSESKIYLSINLARNLIAKKKDANSYLDACELANNHSLLKSVQLDDDQIIDGLRLANQNIPNASWALEIRLGEKGVFQYSIKPEIVNISLFLKVC